MSITNIDNLPPVTVGTTSVRLIEAGTKVARVNLDPSVLIFRVPDGTNGTVAFSGTVSMALIQRYTDATDSTASPLTDAQRKALYLNSMTAADDPVQLQIGPNVECWVWTDAGTCSINPVIGTVD